MKNNSLPGQLVALIQHIHLNESGWWDKSIEQFVRASMWIHGKSLDSSQLCEVIADCIGIEIPAKDIETSLDRLRQNGDVFQTDNNKFTLSQIASDQVSQNIEQYESYENATKTIFIDYLGNNQYNGDPIVIWKKFREEVITCSVEKPYTPKD